MNSVTIACISLLCVVSTFSATEAFSPARTSHSAKAIAAPQSRLASSIASTLPEGMIKTVTQSGNGKFAALGDIATVKYTCYLVGDDDGTVVARGDRQKMIVGDGTMVPGWDKALRSMTVGERSIVRLVDSELGYGSAGVPPVVPENSQLELDIELLDVQPPISNIDFDSIATADNTPRTASDIQAAYEQRQAMRAMEPQTEGFQGFLEKARNFYFFGFFEGETGQQAPWYLRPSITFPLAFLVVGVAFYISFASGAIYERGASVTDELDELVVTWNSHAHLLDTDVGLESSSISSFAFALSVIIG